MLAIGRKPGEVINLYTADGKVRIVVVQARGSRYVRLGIDAPQSVVIKREEIDDRESA